MEKFVRHSLFARAMKTEYNINHKGQFNKSPRGRVYRQEIIARNQKRILDNFKNKQQ